MNAHAESIMNAVIHYPNPDLSAIRDKLAGAKTNSPPSIQAAEFVMSYL